jgi:hypothetical protein
MEFYLRRPTVRKETVLETKPSEETREEIKMETEKIQQNQIQETKEEAEQVVLPQEERIITISWEGEKEEIKEEKEDDWNIPKIDFKIKKEEIKKEEQEPIDLSQI